MWSGQSLLQFDRQAITGCHLMGRWRKGRQYDVLQLLDLCATLVPSKVQTIEGMFSWHICSQYRDPRDQFCYWCVCVCVFVHVCLRACDFFWSSLKMCSACVVCPNLSVYYLHVRTLNTFAKSATIALSSFLGHHRQLQWQVKWHASTPRVHSNQMSFDSIANVMLLH